VVGFYKDAIIRGGEVRPRCRESRAALALVMSESIAGDFCASCARTPLGADSPPNKPCGRPLAVGGACGDAAPGSGKNRAGGGQSAMRQIALARFWVCCWPVVAGAPAPLARSSRARCHRRDGRGTGFDSGLVAAMRAVVPSASAVGAALHPQCHVLPGLRRENQLFHYVRPGGQTARGSVGGDLVLGR
jgi:hypothetical protein